MSEWRTKASEIYAAGEAERGNFTPHGVPARIYNWWLHHSPSKKARDILDGSRRENFCHFWRVVVIWAGLVWLGLKFSNNAEKVLTVLLATLGIVTVIAVAVTDSWLAVLAGFGVISGVGVVIAVLAGLAALVNRYWNDNWNALAAKIFLIVLVSIGISVFVLGIVLSIINYGWVFLMLLSAAIGGTTLALIGLSKWATYLSGKRALARRAEQERIHNMTNDEYLAWRREQNRPGKWTMRVDAFFGGIGDFLILVTQIVRVKKWKICPFVEVDTNA